MECTLPPTSPITDMDGPEKAFEDSEYPDSGEDEANFEAEEPKTVLRSRKESEYPDSDEDETNIEEEKPETEARSPSNRELWTPLPRSPPQRRRCACLQSTITTTPPFTRTFLRRHHSEDSAAFFNKLSMMDRPSVAFGEKDTDELATTPSRNPVLVQQLTEYKSLLTKREQEV